MDRQRVVSSNVASIGYDPVSGVLEVEFNEGHIYQYARVPLGVYEAFMRAPSKGSYLNDVIKGRFGYRQVR